jgi:hypothetical protein
LVGEVFLDQGYLYQFPSRMKKRTHKLNIGKYFGVAIYSIGYVLRSALHRFFRRIFGQPAWLCEGGRRRALYGYSTSSTETQSQHTPLPDGATIYSAIGRSNAKETIELGQCNWGGINEADHLLNYQFLPINLGSTELLPMHTRQIT